MDFVPITWVIESVQPTDDRPTMLQRHPPAMSFSRLKTEIDGLLCVNDVIGTATVAHGLQARRNAHRRNRRAIAVTLGAVALVGGAMVAAVRFLG